MTTESAIDLPATIDEQPRVIAMVGFLAEVSKVLSASLDYRVSLKGVSRLCVPEIADWCAIDLYNASTDAYEQVGFACAGLEGMPYAVDYCEARSPKRNQNKGMPQVIATGVTEFFPHITDSILTTLTHDTNRLEFMRGMQFQSIIIVPINVQKKPIGAISLAVTDAHQIYTDDDVHFVEELAIRVSLAVTNALLYDDSIREIKKRKRLEKELLAERRALESRVKERTEQLQHMNQGLRDEIAKRHQIEEVLQENSANLLRSNQELQDFAYVASHDLQEPLRKIQAFGNLLESEYSQELGEGVDYLQRMQKAAARMGILIEDLLSFSRVTTKARESVNVDLNVIVADVLVDLEARIEETSGVICVEELPTVKADPTHMRQLFQNLIGNALKFHRPDEAPNIQVNFIGDGPNYYEIHVVDNGIGFDQKYVDRIFAVFQRLHDRDTYTGTGIGLAVCRKIVERYGGTITAKGTKNNGATFVVRLSKKGEVRA